MQGSSQLLKLKGPNISREKPKSCKKQYDWTNQESPHDKEAELSIEFNCDEIIFSPCFFVIFSHDLPSTVRHLYIPDHSINNTERRQV